jgi:hypothetical protein
MSAPLSLEAPIVREVRRPARRYLLLGLLADQQALGAVAAVAGPQIKAESIAGDQNLGGVTHVLRGQPEPGRETRKAEGEGEARESGLGDAFRESLVWNDLVSRHRKLTAS